MAGSTWSTVGTTATSAGSILTSPRRRRRARPRRKRPSFRFSLVQKRKMEVADLIAPSRVVANLRAATKRQVLQELARRAAGETGLHERKIFDGLLERERLGTTGLGMGTAIPHAKL